MAEIDFFSGRNRNNLHGDLHKRVRHEDRGVWLCFTSKRLPKVCHLTSYETNNISPALKEFLNDVDFRNTWNILDFTIVMIGLVFNLLLSPQQSEYSIKLAPIQFLKNYENLFFLSLFSSLLAVLQIQVYQPSNQLSKPEILIQSISISSYSGPQCEITTSIPCLETSASSFIYT